MPTGPVRQTLGARVRRLALYAFIGVVVLYFAGAGAGYAWMRYMRKNEQVTYWQVAFLRWRAVRIDMAKEQFAQAKKEWDARAFQSAYLLYSTAVRNDPNNIPGRLSAAQFFTAAGAVNMAIGLLEDGLVRSPNNPELIEQTFDLLTTRGRDQRALALAHRLSGSNGAAPTVLIQRYEVLATLNSEGAAAAGRVLAKYPALMNDHKAAPVVSRVLWESQDRFRAIELMANYVKTSPEDYSSWAQLAHWQQAGGMTTDALETARRAVAQFPAEIGPRLLVIELLGQPAPGSAEWQKEIDSYLRAFSARPESIAWLAELAGRFGWLDLARACYETGATKLPDLSMLALYYADALGARGQYADSLRVLAQVESQTTGATANFLVQLRQRQVLIANAQGNRDFVRESARRLGSVIANDQDTLQGVRQRFIKLGINDAVAELSGPVAAAVKTTATR
jgi:hypothetical protein